MIWQTSRFSIDLAEPRVMGIVNATPDSFSDGGRHGSTAAALRHCEQLLRDGAHILDIGGESTRPGSPAVPLDEELARVVPLVQGAVSLGVPISIDTYKPEVMRAVLDLGADIINDIWALRQPGAAEVVASHPQCGVCLMHMHRDPQTMQVAPMEGDVVQQVLYFLQRSALDLQALGVEKNRIVLDPGIGFGKTVEQNFALLAHQSVLRAAGYPLLHSSEVHYEAELVLLVGKAGKHIPEDEAMDYIAGYGLGLDLTARDLQTKAKQGGLPWAVAKGFDCAATVTPFVPANTIQNPFEIQFEMHLNGHLRQHGDIRKMLFSIPLIVHYLSTVFALQEGDLIFTGTPEGVGSLTSLDKIRLVLPGHIDTEFDVI